MVEQKLTFQQWKILVRKIVYDATGIDYWYDPFEGLRVPFEDANSYNAGTTCEQRAAILIARIDEYTRS